MNKKQVESKEGEALTSKKWYKKIEEQYLELVKTGNLDAMKVWFGEKEEEGEKKEEEDKQIEE